jgi:hypothetical protein
MKNTILDMSLSMRLYRLLDAVEYWDIYVQDGPCDGVMLVNNSLNIGIIADDFGLTSFPLPLDRLTACGWAKIGEL